MTEHEFQSRVTAHMETVVQYMADANARARIQDERWEAIARMVQEIRSGTMCPVGIRVSESVQNLAKSDDSQWKSINELNKLARNAGVIIAGCGVITASVVLFRAVAAFFGRA
jgi:hypothetical protein